MYETLKVVGIATVVRTAIWFRKKTVNLCTSDSEECECVVGADVNDT